MRLPAAERREQLISTATSVFAEQGFHATSMNDVAEAAGVTKPVLYQHFSSKRDLFVELLTEIGNQLRDRIAKATADAVGRRLARLAGSAQILVVTHSPQVAARGAHHWRVEKRLAGDVASSVVTALGPAERVDELARMLSGENVTEAARDAARALLSA